MSPFSRKKAYGGEILGHRDRAPEQAEVKAWDALDGAVNDVERTTAGHAPVGERQAIEQLDDCSGRQRRWYGRLEERCDRPSRGDRVSNTVALWRQPPRQAAP